MTSRLRKFALVAHIVFSVGWLGAIVPYLALAIAGLTSHDAQTMRAAYLAMELIGWYVIVPLGLAAWLSGLVQSLGTPWGLLRHWWVVMKFLLTSVAVAILLEHMRDVSRVAKEATLSSGNFRPELIHAGGGLVVLLTITLLAVFKPWGKTAYGQRRASEACAARGETPLVREPVLATGRPRWGLIIGIHAVGLFLLAAVLHVAGIHHGIHH